MPDLHNRRQEQREPIQRRPVHKQRHEHQKHLWRTERFRDFGEAEDVEGHGGGAVEVESSADYAEGRGVRRGRGEGWVRRTLFELECEILDLQASRER